MPSYERIHYGLRPAKHIERKMLVEAFQRLHVFRAVDSYRYIGFGSIYFSDFLLVHKALGIKDMVSIEREDEDKDRFQFNRPFNCIQIEFGESNSILPQLSWDVPAIIWLDYDDPLAANMLIDVAFVCANAAPGSFLIVSANAQGEKITEQPLEKLSERVGSESVPHGVQVSDLAGWGTARVYRTILTNTILTTISNRSRALDEGQKLEYKQLVNFHYADGVKMLTVGGVIHSNEQTSTFQQGEFQSLKFHRPGEEAYKIEAPQLTYRELRYLDTQLPLDDCGGIDRKGIPLAHVERYSRVYRYYPTYADAEM